jgi:hypothetical protein
MKTSMGTNIELRTGYWLLVVGPRAIYPTLLALTARLAEAGPVRVVDGGNHYNVYPVARAARGQPEVLERIRVSRAFTCYQMLALLEGLPAGPVPFVVLDLLGMFYDENVRVGERKRLLGQCLAHLNRLEKAAAGVVSAHPPKVPSQTARELLGQLQASAADTYFIQSVAPAPEPLRLF